MEGQENKFEPLRGVPVTGIVLSNKIRPLLNEHLMNNTLDIDGLPETATNYFTYKLNLYGNEPFTATYYFVDRTNGLKNFFYSVQRYIRMDTVNTICWEEAAEWFVQAMSI